MRYICDIDSLWSDVEPFIKRCLVEMGTTHLYTTDWVKERIQKKEFQCWVLGDFDAIAVTEILEYPTGYREFSIWCVVGDNIRHWLKELYEKAVLFAKNNLCNGLYGNGRDDWKTVFERLSGREVTTETVLHLRF